jgi:hypothetical protein
LHGRRHAPTGFAKTKNPGALSGPRGSFLSRKRWNPGHPVRARRSLRSERLRRDRRSERDSRAPDKGAHAAPPTHSVPRREASCRDRINMGSTMKTDSVE